MLMIIWNFDCKEQENSCNRFNNCGKLDGPILLIVSSRLSMVYNGPFHSD